MTNPHVVILGAGPAGLGASYRLRQQGISYVAVERNNSAGGLCRTLSFGEYKTDIGPHRFYSRNHLLYELIAGLLGDSWGRVTRVTRFYINGRFFHYPIDLLPTLAKLGVVTSRRIITDYLKAQLQYRHLKQAPSSFEEAAIARFGRSLSELNMLNYTEKIWGMPARSISSDWLHQRIEGISFFDLLRGSIVGRKKSGRLKTLAKEFYYPREGTGMIYQRLHDESQAHDPAAFMPQSRPGAIWHEAGRITRIEVLSAAGVIPLHPAHVISSIALPELVSLLRPTAPEQVLSAARQLRFRAHVGLFLILRQPQVSSDHWMYFPAKDIPFGRLMEPKNFSSQMAPADRTSLMVEFFCQEEDALWRSSADHLCRQAVPWLEKMGILSPACIEAAHVHREAQAYPLYELGYQHPVAVVKDYLRGIKNLQLVGRGGCFRYNNQDHALTMGMTAADHIGQRRLYPLEGPAEGAEYFEISCGPIKKKT